MLQPTTQESKLKLVEEIKNRAKGCISSQNFPVAVQLYTKAIEVLAGGAETTAALAILRANRSMCYLSVNNPSAAYEDAVEAERLDLTYLKVYYRKSAALKALGRLAEAKEAIQRGLQAKPDDKEMLSLLSKIDAEIASSASSRSTSVKAQSTGKTSCGGASSIAAPSAKTAGGAKQTASTPTRAEGVEEDDEEENLGNVRGYKKTADGRITTFFNNDLDETAKKLIGDIAPKKLEAAPPSVAVETATANGTSVWNSAGTYEERQLSPWASAELKRSLSALASHIPAPGVAGVQSADLCVAEVENVTGDAQVSMVRGKKKHLADYCADVKWTLTAVVDAGKVDTISGRVQVLDISADQEFEVGTVEVTHYNGNSASLSSLPQHAGQLVTRYVKAGPDSTPLGLQALVRAALVQFCVDLKTK